MQQAAATLGVSEMVVRRLIAQKSLPAKQIVKFAPWMIERSHLDLPSVRKEIRHVHQGRRTGWARLAKTKRGYSRIPMKLSLNARRTRQRLRIRVPASRPSFVNVLQTGSFGIWGYFRKVRRQPFSHRLRKACP